MIKGIGKDAPVTTNNAGGKQSIAPYACELLPPRAILSVAKVMGDGAEKYEKDNWRKIPRSDHLRKMLTHVFAWLAGDRQDDHLEHAACRMLMALETDDEKGVNRRDEPRADEALFDEAHRSPWLFSKVEIGDEVRVGKGFYDIPEGAWAVVDRLDSTYGGVRLDYKGTTRWASRLHLTGHRKRKTRRGYPVKRQWTEANIAEAQRVVGECWQALAACPGNRVRIVEFLPSFVRVAVMNYGDRKVNTGHFEGKASTQDEPNTTIGLMVAMCKAAGKGLPQWV